MESSIFRLRRLLDPYDDAVAGCAAIRWHQNNASSVDEGIAGYYQGLGGGRMPIPSWYWPCST